MGENERYLRLLSKFAAINGVRTPSLVCKERAFVLFKPWALRVKKAIQNTSFF